MILTKKIFCLGFLLCLIASPITIINASEVTETKTLEMASIADTQVSAGDNADLNYGRYANMGVRGRAAKDKNYYESYLKFALPKTVTSVKEAKLKLTYYSADADVVGQSHTIYTTDTGWNEGAGNVNGVENATVENRLTYNNASQLAATHTDNFTTFEITGNTPARGDVLTIDVTSIVNNYLKDNVDGINPTEVSFRIASDATTNKKGLVFRAKEVTTGGAPLLSFSYDYTYTPVVPEAIYDGLYYKSEEIYNSSGLDVDMFTLEMDSKSPLTIVTGVPNNVTPLQVGSRQTPSGQAAAAQKDGYNVLAAINADFFRINEDDAIQPRGLTVKDGVELTPINEWKFFGVLKDGTPIIGDANKYNEVKSNLMHAVGADSGYLVENGVPITVNADGGCHSEDTVAPRTAIGIKEDGSVVMTVADGRSTISNGLVLTDLAKYMAEQGCVTAVNLDGGGSSAMSIKDMKTNTFAAVNNPSDGEEREVGNTLLIIDPTTSINRTNINKTLSIAENVLKNYTFGTNPGEYPSEQKTIIEEKVNAIYELLNKTGVTQQEVDAADKELKDILSNLDSTKIPINKDELNSLVNEVNSLINNSKFGTDKDNYPIEQKDVLNQALAEALIVLTKTDVTQEEIDTASNELQIVIDKFKASKINVDTKEIRTLVSDLNAKINDSSNEEYTKEQKNILRLLLVGAEDVINNPESTQEEIDSAIAAIKETLNGFNNSANNSNNNNNDNNINDNTNNDINKEDGNNNFIVPAIIISITIVIVGVSIILFARKKV